MRKLRDEISAWYRSLPKCPICNESMPIGVIEPQDPERWTNFARVVCGNCSGLVEWRQRSPSGFIGWQPWPTTDMEHGRDRRQSRRALKPNSETFCEICLRTPDQLVHPDTIEVQHIIEKADGGTDDPENLAAYCKACHSWVNWMRTYVSRREAARRENA